MQRPGIERLAGAVQRQIEDVRAVDQGRLTGLLPGKDRGLDPAHKASRLHTQVDGGIERDMCDLEDRLEGGRFRGPIWVRQSEGIFDPQSDGEALAGARRDHGRDELLQNLLSDSAIGPPVSSMGSPASTLLIDDTVGGCELEPSAVCEADDLAGANLQGLDLHEITFTGANLTGADLAGANLTGAFLSGTNFTGANLTGAILDGRPARSHQLHERHHRKHRPGRPRTVQR